VEDVEVGFFLAAGFWTAGVFRRPFFGWELNLQAGKFQRTFRPLQILYISSRLTLSEGLECMNHQTFPFRIWIPNNFR